MTDSAPAPAIEPEQTPHGTRYRCPSCETLHEFMTNAVICLLLHPSED